MENKDKKVDTNFREMYIQDLVESVIEYATIEELEGDEAEVEDNVLDLLRPEFDAILYEVLKRL